ncbi:MAG: hypothetical protein ACI4BI_04920 [Anaerotardibacter sp.]
MLVKKDSHQKGHSIEEFLYDESVNWKDNPEENPTTHFDFRTEVIVL